MHATQTCHCQVGLQVILGIPGKATNVSLQLNYPIKPLFQSTIMNMINAVSIFRWTAAVIRHIMCTLHTGLGVGMASGSPSGAEKKKKHTQMPSGQICLWWETEGKREGLFNWWWAGEKQRQKKMRGSTEWEKKSMRSSERNDDIGVEAAWKEQQILWVDRKAEKKRARERNVASSKVLKEDWIIYVKSGERQEGLSKK